MIQRLHNWKDKIKVYFLKNYKSASFLVLFVLVGVFMRPQEGQAVVGKLIAVGGAALGVYLFGDEAAEGVLSALVSIVGILIGALNMFLFWLVTIAIWMIVQIAGFQTFINEPSVIAGWTLARDVVNMGFIIFLLYLAFTLILGLNKSWQGSLLKLLLMVILVNFSRMIVGLLIDVSQVVMLTFVNGFRNIIGANIIGNLNLKFGFSDMTFKLSTAVANITRAMLGTFIGVILLSTLAMMAVWLLLRIVKLWLLTILAPFYFLTLTAPIPMAGGFAGYWKKEFTNQLIAGPFMAFGIWFSMSLLSNTNKAGSIFDSGGQYGEANLFGTNAADVSSQSQTVYRAIIGAGLLYGVFDMSKKMAGEAAVVGDKIFGAVSSRAKSGAVGLLKASTLGTAKALDWGVSQYTQRKFGRDISVGGAKRYLGGKWLEAKEFKTAFEAKSIIAADKMQNARNDRRAKVDPRYKALEEKKDTLGATAKNLKGQMAKDDKSMSLKDRLESEQKAGGLAQRIQAEIRNKNYPVAKALLDQAGDALSPEMKESLSRQLAFMRMNETDQKFLGDTFGGSASNMIMSDSALSDFRNKGFIDDNELEQIKGKSFTDLEKTNPDLAAKLKQRVADGQSFVAAGGQSKDLQNLLIRGKAADTVIGQWKGGQGGQVSDADKQALGLGDADSALLSRDRLGVVEDRTKKENRDADKQTLKNLEEELKQTGQEQHRVVSKYKADYLKSTSKRVRSGRVKQARADQKAIMKRQFPLHETVDDLVELANNPSLQDDEILAFVMDELKPEDVTEFMKRSNVTADAPGTYEFFLRRHGKLGNDQAGSELKQILSELRTNGDLPEEKEKKLLGAMDKLTEDPSVRETVQQFLNKAKKEIPSLRFATMTDPYSGQFKFTPIDDREEAELEELLRRHIIPEKYEGFVNEQDNGSFDLSSVGFSYFVKAFGKVIKKMQEYNDDYLEALVKNRDEILSQVGVGDDNYENIQEALKQLQKHVYNLRKDGAKQKAYRKFKKPQISNNP